MVTAMSGLGLPLRFRLMVPVERVHGRADIVFGYGPTGAAGLAGNWDGQ